MKFKIFIINLDRAKDRYQRAVAQFSAWPDLAIERVSAAEGKLLPLEKTQQFYSESLNVCRYHKLLNAAEIGCFISHIRCWQKIVEEKLDFALILEDDFVLKGDIDQLIEDISEIKSIWHYFKLASPYKQKKVLASSFLANYEVVYFNKMPVSTVAQAISFPGAQQLLKNTQCFYMPVDVFLQHSWLAGVDALGLQPYCFDANHAFESQIQEKHKVKSNRFLFFKNRMTFALQNYRFNRQQLPLFFEKFSAKREHGRRALRFRETNCWRG